ncbi:MAG: serpin family protein [Bacteroidetes bacterium]|nr:serpin family protein [Bacteroidota bacterium]
MKTKILIIFILAAILAGCRDNSMEVQSPSNQLAVRELNALEKSVVSSDNAFGLKLFTHINAVQHNENVFISPFSVSMALGMALNGAEGSTLDSMKKVIEHSEFTLQEINESYRNISYILTNLDPEVAFQIANSIWCDNNFQVLPAFLNDCQSYFDAEAASLDFSSPSSVQTINAWVNSKTNGKIQTILEQIPPEVVMYLINAIYFKGAWTYQFDPAKTVDAQFTTSTGSSVLCSMMNQKTVYMYAETQEAQVIDLPYGSRLFSMTLVLPKEGINIDQFAGGLTQQKWDELIGYLDSNEVSLSMPKFKLEYEKEINDELKAMGMSIAFGSSANFSKIAPGIWIDEVRHKTFVEVNEEGTEAAAVTIISFIRGLSPVMSVNRPFIFAIREHHSGTILFIGKIVNPSV